MPNSPQPTWEGWTGASSFLNGLTPSQLALRGFPGLPDSPTAGCHTARGSQVGGPAAWVGASMLARPLRGPPSPIFVVLHCCLGAQVADWEKEDLTPLPVNNGFLLAADPSGLSHREGQSATASVGAFLPQPKAPETCSQMGIFQLKEGLRTGCLGPQVLFFPLGPCSVACRPH